MPDQSFLLSFSLRERRLRGRRWHLPLLWPKNMRPKKWWTPCLRRGQRTLALVSSPTSILQRTFLYGARDVKNICYLNNDDDNFPPRSLMHFSLKSRKLEFEVPIWKPVFVFDLPQARTFSPSVIWRALWNGLATSACRGSAPSFTNVWRFPLQSTSSPRLWIARQVCLITHGPQNLSLG